ncbi:MAG: flagellar basal body protein, partial [Lachnospiraceae bacterium]|nr:flagellar basal body protein [Lachnospiraceae bacterium]
MPSTFFGLNIGTTGLFAAKTGLNTTSHNIANIETKGYTRQSV